MTLSASAGGWVARCGTIVARAAAAKPMVELGFTGPLTGGVSSRGTGGRDSAQMVVDLHNADPSMPSPSKE